MIVLVAFSVAAAAGGALVWSIGLVPRVVVEQRARWRAGRLAMVPPRPRVLVRASRRARRAISRGRDDDSWAAWLDAAARSARTGGSLRQALADAATAFRDTPLDAVLVPLARDLTGGMPWPSALDRLTESDASTTTTRLVGRALRLAVRAGGPAAAVLDSVASTLHDRAASEREIRALSTQARTSALVMAASPLAFTVLAGGADPRVLGFLSTGPGVACLAAGIALDGAGAVWMARIVAAAR